MDLTKILSEALKMPHFNDRVYQRLRGPYTTFSDESKDIQKTVFNNIELLAKVNFLGQDNIGVILYVSSKYYKYEAVVDGKQEKSEGNYIWAVVRGNDLETIFFSPAGYKPQNTQVWLKIEDIIKYVTETKNGDFNITDKDLRKLANPQAQQVAPPKPTETVFNIQGVKWVLSPDKNYLVKKNNNNDKMSVDDALDILPHQEAERLFDMV